MKSVIKILLALIPALAIVIVALIQLKEKEINQPTQNSGQIITDQQNEAEKIENNQKKEIHVEGDYIEGDKNTNMPVHTPKNNVTTRSQSPYHTQVNVENSPGAVTTVHHKGDLNITEIKEEYRPEISLIEHPQEIQKQDMIETTFLFGSSDGAALIDPIVRMNFVNKIDTAYGAVVGRGMVLAGDLKRSIDKDDMSYIISTDILHPGNFFRVIVLSKQSLKLSSLEMAPRKN